MLCNMESKLPLSLELFIQAMGILKLEDDTPAPIVSIEPRVTVLDADGEPDF